PECSPHVGDHVSIHGSAVVQTGSVILDDSVGPTLHAVPTKHFEHHIFGRHPRGQLASKPHAPDLRHANAQRFTCDRRGHLKTTHAHGEHAQGPRSTGV